MDNVQSLLTLHRSIGRLKKTKKHGALGYKYAELSQILELLNPILDREKKYVTFDINYEQIGGEVKPVLIGELHTSDNQVLLSSKVPLIGLEMSNTRNSPMQNLGSAITYARRYCLLNMFNLCAEDDDGEQGIIRIEKRNNMRKTAGEIYNEWDQEVSANE